MGSELVADEGGPSAGQLRSQRWSFERLTANSDENELTGLSELKVYNEANFGWTGCHGARIPELWPGRWGSELWP